MIQEYHRPTDLAEALALLARSEPLTLPLGGGTVLSQPQPQERTPLLADRSSALAVVDVQALGLDTIERRGSGLVLGAAVRLQTLLELPELPPALAKALRLEASYNLRCMRTLAGALVSADGRSPLAAALLALDAMIECTWQGGKRSYTLGELLPQRKALLTGKLITRITIPLSAALRYEYSARTPADRPLVCAAVARWASGRTRVALGGYGAMPLLVADGTADAPASDSLKEGEFGGLALAAREAYSLAGDEWASAEYRCQAAAELVERCLSPETR